MNPAEVKSMAVLVVKKLQLMRAAGTATPQRPITAADLVAAYNLKFGTNVRAKEDFWEVVGYIRAEMGLPLGSNGDGYFWCLTEKEWEETAARLRERIKTQQRAIDRPTLSFANSRQMDILADAVKNNFDAVRV